MPGRPKHYNGDDIFIIIIPEAVALMFVFSVGAGHFSLSRKIPLGVQQKTIMQDRQRVKERNKLHRKRLTF